MASKRQIKKQTKAAIKKLALKQLGEIQDLNLENAEIDKEIAKLKKQIKKKKQRLAQLRAELERVNELGERNLLNTFNQKISIADLKVYAEKAKDSGDDYNAAEHWAAIKRYNELVDIGLIPKGTIFDKYDAAEYMQSILSPEQVNRMINEAEEKASFLRAKAVTKQRSNYSFD